MENYPNLPHHVGQNFFALPPIPDNVVTIESPCVNLSWMYHTHFGHWVTDVLPKIGILKLLHYDLNSFKYILQDPIPSFAIESLACLGIEPSNILSHNGSVMRFKKLWSPSKLMRVWDWVHPLGTDFLRDMAKSLPCDMIPLTHEIPQSVYLSRADSTKRFLKNEEQLSLKLAEYGITPLITSRFSFAERLLVMSKVSRVVGSLGSNVLNALFSGEKEVRGVLFADSDGIDMALATQNMARCTGHKYVYLLGERAIASGESAEWTINPDEVINAFESL